MKEGWLNQATKDKGLEGLRDAMAAGTVHQKEQFFNWVKGVRGTPCCAVAHVACALDEEGQFYNRKYGLGGVRLMTELTGLDRDTLMAASEIFEDVEAGGAQECYLFLDKIGIQG